MAAKPLGSKKAVIQYPQSKQRFFFLSTISIKLSVFISDGIILCFRQELDLCIRTIVEYFLLKFWPQPNFTRRMSG